MDGCVISKIHIKCYSQKKAGKVYILCCLQSGGKKPPYRGACHLFFPIQRNFSNLIIHQLPSIPSPPFTGNTLWLSSLKPPTLAENILCLLQCPFLSSPAGERAPLHYSNPNKCSCSRKVPTTSPWLSPTTNSQLLCMSSHED
jgi:hypothetical protein